MQKNKNQKAQHKLRCELGLLWSELDSTRTGVIMKQTKGLLTKWLWVFVGFFPHGYV